MCTLFMLLLCLTGLPLIFHHEIGHLLGTEVESPQMPADTPRVSLDKIVEVARAQHPDRIVQYMSQEPDDDSKWFVTLTPTPEPTNDFKSVVVDARSGEILGQPTYNSGFMWVMLKLHVDLFAGLPGKLFLGLMGILLLISIVSGVVLYAPFMRRLRFGEVRRDRSPRLKWLDLHNLLGIVTLAWLFVVAATGVINTWAELLVYYWQQEELQHLLAAYQGQPLVAESMRASLQQTVEAATAATDGQKISFIAFPGTAFSTPHHVTVLFSGDTPLTARLLNVAMVDALSGEVTDTPQMPWYLTALLISQPLHFGDYAGMPMQIIWALLDIASIVVLCSGLYLWLKRSRRTSNASPEEPEA